jgi:uncharacterized protein YbjT (DUF2867 family)
MMRIFVTGASGFIGRHIVHALLGGGHEVIAGVHRTSVFCDAPGVTPVSVDFAHGLRPDDWLPRLSGVDAVINAVGIIAERRNSRFDDLHRDAPIALFEACRRAGVRKVIQISALGADDSAFSRYHLSKKAADDFLAATDLDWVVLQPSLVFGPGGQSSALFGALAAMPLIPLIGDGGQKIQPIHVDDLVRVILRLLEPDAPVRLRLPVVGPEPMTLRECLTVLRHWLGFGKPHFISVPHRWVLAMADRLGTITPTPFNGEALRMLQQGNTGDPEILPARLGLRPEGLASALRNRPATPADRVYSGLFLILPALRYALALLWIWSGLTSAFLFPERESLALLAATGITGEAAPWVLYGAAALDIVLGVALLARFHVVLVGLLQLVLIFGYTAVITVSLPEFWLHPFAPIAKNIPIIVATLAVMASEKR